MLSVASEEVYLDENTNETYHMLLFRTLNAREHYGIKTAQKRISRKTASVV
jgi:hypothetical protein